MNGIKTILTMGTGGLIIDTECHLSNGLPSITIVGLGNRAIDEAKERVRSSFASSNLVLPRKRITINLAPADIPKESTSFDLAIAVAILQADQQITLAVDGGSAFIGELGLQGDIRAVRGIIGKLLAGKQLGIECFYIPVANMAQALLVPDITLVAVASLRELYAGLRQEIDLVKQHSGAGQLKLLPTLTPTDSLSEIVGQERAKRGVLIAASGGHNILLCGPPGTGKSMLAKALPSLLPPPTQTEVLEITQLHSLVAGNYERLVTERPFRAPHHSASHIAIVGGGNALRPGEISLAHRGVLFFDELPEFSRDTIEALRQPLEDRTITVSRARDNIAYPAHFMLVATANPCPCGYFGTARLCTCPAGRIQAYRQKLSGPIIDRIDLYINVENVAHSQLLTTTNTGNHTALYKKVLQARAIQRKRFGSPAKLNADMTNADIRQFAQLTDKAHKLLTAAAGKLNLSARSYMRTVKVARTIADLSDSPNTSSEHISEALQYRDQTPK